MSVHVVKVPDIGEGIAEVELVEWHVAAGRHGGRDQVLADVMTDKATVEVPSPVAGRVLALRGEAGRQARRGQRAAPHRGRRRRRAPQAAATPARPWPLPRRPRRSPTAVAAAARTPVVAGEPLRPSRSRRRRCAATRASWASTCAQVRGNGPDGRILHDDVVRARAARRRRRRASRRRARERYARAHRRAAVPVIGLRRQIAARMRTPLRIPHFTYVEEVDVTELEALRARLNDEHGEDARAPHAAAVPDARDRARRAVRSRR